MVYGIAKMLNFAHGDVIMVGAYVILTCITRGGMSPVIAVILSVVVCTVLGVVIEKVAYSPLRKASSNLAVLDHCYWCQLSAPEPGPSDLRSRCQEFCISSESSVCFSVWRTADDQGNYYCDNSCMYCYHGRTFLFCKKDQARSCYAGSI